MTERVIGSTLLQALAVLVLSTALALALNATRPRGLRISKNYFDKPVGQAAVDTSLAAINAQAEDPNPEADHRTSEPTIGNRPSAMADPNRGESDGAAAVAEAPTDPYPVGKFGFREITTTQVRQLIDDPRAEEFAILVVDARNDAFYQAGRIPRAVQLDHYYADQYMTQVAPLANAAEWVVVYCGGGDCEDSLLACNDLVLEGVPQEKLLLYKGGWKEWTDAGQPVETEGDA